MSKVQGKAGESFARQLRRNRTLFRRPGQSASPIAEQPVSLTIALHEHASCLPIIKLQTAAAGLASERVAASWSTQLASVTPQDAALQSAMEHVDNLLALDSQPRKEGDMSGEVTAKLHLVEKHIRKNKLQVGCMLLPRSPECQFCCGQAWLSMRLASSPTGPVRRRTAAAPCLTCAGAQV